MYQFGWLSERGGNFLNLLQEEGDLERGWGFPQKKRGEEGDLERGWGFPQKKRGEEGDLERGWGFPQKKKGGGVPTLEETMTLYNF